MKLSEGIIRPGTVRQVLENGVIKVSAPGLFSDEDTPDSLPPVYRFASGGTNSSTSVEVLDEVWVLSFNDNPTQLYWIRKDNDIMSDHANKSLQETSEEIRPGKNAEILFNKIDQGSQGSIHYSAESGMVIKKDDCIIQLDKSGNIKIYNDAPGKIIEINNNKILIGGNETNTQPAVLGNNLQLVINDITEAIATVQGAAMKSPYTMQIALALAPLVAKLQMESNGILSNNVKVG